MGTGTIPTATKSTTPNSRSRRPLHIRYANLTISQSRGTRANLRLRYAMSVKHRTPRAHGDGLMDRTRVQIEGRQKSITPHIKSSEPFHSTCITGTLLPSRIDEMLRTSHTRSFLLLRHSGQLPTTQPSLSPHFFAPAFLSTLPN